MNFWILLIRGELLTFIIEYYNYVYFEPIIFLKYIDYLKKLKSKSKISSLNLTTFVDIHYQQKEIAMNERVSIHPGKAES